MSRHSISKERRLRTITTLPPDPDAEARERSLARLRSMTKREFFESLVHAGIYTPEGKLTQKYAGACDLYPVLTDEQMGKVPPKKTVRKKATQTAPRRASAKKAVLAPTGATRRKTVKKASRR
jgi:hypothetical protein